MGVGLHLQEENMAKATRNSDHDRKSGAELTFNFRISNLRISEYTMRLIILMFLLVTGCITVDQVAVLIKLFY